ncbi:hypothetical protein SELMODRAFT_414414 [Selaginella moellendorffii]|uniref:BHLH domain-containing protein n=1 Tax=Selaginella moellendorffii TaxID=88036 RepID=D8RSN9_SELML|nr:hypothetical protein SELMODRAFT_414414 [Selaginella moellendorffii]
MGIVCEPLFFGGDLTRRSCRRRQEVACRSSKGDCDPGGGTGDSCLTSDHEAAAAAAAEDCSTELETAPIRGSCSVNDSSAGSSGGSSSSWTWQSNSPGRIVENVLEQVQSKASSPSSSPAAAEAAVQGFSEGERAVENWHNLLQATDLRDDGIETLPSLVSAAFPSDQEQHKARFPSWDNRPSKLSSHHQADYGCFMQQDGAAFGSSSNVFRPPPQFVDSHNLSLSSQGMLFERQHQHQQEFNSFSSHVSYPPGGTFNCHDGVAVTTGNSRSNLELLLGSSAIDFKQPQQEEQQITSQCQGAFGGSWSANGNFGINGQAARRNHTGDGGGGQSQAQQLQSIFLPGQGSSRKSGIKTVEEMSRRCSLQENNRDAKRHKGSTAQRTRFGASSKRGNSHKREPALNTNLKPRAKQGCANDPQSIAARQRRERISDRLKILQELIPNGSKVDLVTMLEKAINYVKFLQLQVKVLMNDEYWPPKGDGEEDYPMSQKYLFMSKIS